MPERQKCRCPCGEVFYAELYKSASYSGLVFKNFKKSDYKVRFALNAGESFH